MVKEITKLRLFAVINNRSKDLKEIDLTEYDEIKILHHLRETYGEIKLSKK